jgi:hypothetical protein
VSCDKIGCLRLQSHQQLTIPNYGDVMPSVCVTEYISDEQLLEVYADPYINKVGHDHRRATPIINPQVTYLSAWIDNNFAGAFMAIRFSTLEFELHSLLKKSSLPYSRELGYKFLDWAFSHDSVQRVTAYIIAGLESAKNYCLKLGFKNEGCRKDACMQGGILKDVYILGMTRKDWVLL